ncbi:hypothetical protein GO986_11900 [Deinococcus sp. HMF7620]|uniref:Uncharacterized protein n=1 Tax=Deinococcus arboris TaxID=2682977 RepID=A0A7C9I3I2_9DEIO|nr:MULTISPECIES: hypothetical protein [Deinococcus]MBZ9752177.1 hypothetical protein [Deinococcus betulae]MVN87471.1 hypothetical protein [Deinococcus arboris]
MRPDTLYVLWRALLLTDLLLLRYWVTGPHVLQGRQAVLGGIALGLRERSNLHAPTFGQLFDATAASDDVLHQEGRRLAEALAYCGADLSVIRRKVPALIPLLDHP